MPTARKWIRWLAPVVLLVVLLLAFRGQLTFLGEAVAALRHAALAPVFGAVATSLLAIAAMAAVMRILLNEEAVDARLSNCTAITLASNAWSTSIPGGPALSAWLTYRVHRSWGASTGLCGWFLSLIHI